MREECPGSDRYGENEEKSTEHVFASLDEHMFVVKLEKFDPAILVA